MRPRMTSVVTKRIINVSILFTIVALGFNNCGQTGDLGIVSTDDGAGNTVTGLPDGGAGGGGAGGAGGGGTVGGGGGTVGGGGGTDPMYTYKYVNKTLSRTVDSTANNKVDVLVVIDNSGSMATEQANMAMRFNTFLDQLANLDWQVSIITTDMSEDKALKDGRFVPFTATNPIYTIDSKMGLTLAKQLFADAIQREEQGAGSEQGIKGVYRAIQRAVDPNMLAVNAPNRAFFRDGAVLSVLVVTDADETPPKDANGNRIPELRNMPEELFKYVNTVWMGKKNFVYNSIIVRSGDAVCLGKDGNEGYGKSYEAISKLTGGIVGTVCAADYGSQLTYIGQKVVMQLKSLQLECAPVDSNNDKMVDLKVTYTASANAAPVVIDATKYMVEGALVTFGDYLPVGKYDFDYVCQEKVPVQ